MPDNGYRIDGQRSELSSLATLGVRPELDFQYTRIGVLYFSSIVVCTKRNRASTVLPSISIVIEANTMVSRS